MNYKLLEQIIHILSIYHLNALNKVLINKKIKF